MNEQHDSQSRCPFCPQAVGFVRAICIAGQMKFMTYVCRTCNLTWEIAEPYVESLDLMRSKNPVKRDEP